MRKLLRKQLSGGCRKRVAGYTVKRQYFSAEFTNGIENIGFDSIEGLNSPIFIRTVKLKDFPWNSWLMLGIDAQPDAAWNPIAGFTDGFGQLLWSAIGDPALFSAPYGSGWMLKSSRSRRSSALAESSVLPGRVGAMLVIGVAVYSNRAESAREHYNPIS